MAAGKPGRPKKEIIYTPEEWKQQLLKEIEEAKGNFNKLVNIRSKIGPYEDGLLDEVVVAVNEALKECK